MARAMALPTSWSAYFSDDSEAAYARELLTLLTPSMLKNVNLPAREAGSTSNTTSMMLVLCGPTDGRAVAEPLAALAAPALRQVGEDFEHLLPEQVVGVLSFANALECVGLVDGLLAEAPVETWLSALAASPDLYEELAHRCGFVALASGLPDLAAEFVDGGPLTEDFAPGRTFGFNVQGFVRYLATARKQRASADEVRPAWETFVEAFPLKQAADTLSWRDLLWAARTFEATFAGHPVAEVVARVHARVKPA